MLRHLNHYVDLTNIGFLQLFFHDLKVLTANVRQDLIIEESLSCWRVLPIACRVLGLV